MKTLEETIKKYNIDIKILHALQDNQVDLIDKDEVDKVLEFLTKNKVAIKTIEQCPSILLGDYQTVVNNYNYLLNKHFNKSKINNCIHILIEKEKDLKLSLEYLQEHYDERLINKKLSVLSREKQYIINQEKLLEDYNLNDDLLLSIIIDSNEGSKYEEIFKLCEKYKVEVKSKMFKHSDTNLEEKLELSKELGIDFSIYMLSSSSKNIRQVLSYITENNLEFNEIMYSININELKQIFKELKDNNIKYNVMAFTKNIDELKNIIQVCNDFKLENIPSSVFLRTSKELEDILKEAKNKNIEPKASLFHLNKENLDDLIEFCKEENISLSSDIFYSNVEKIKEILEICEEKDVDFKKYFLRKNPKDLESLIDDLKEEKVPLMPSMFGRSNEEILKIIRLLKNKKRPIKDANFEQKAEVLEKIIELIEKKGLALSSSIMSRNLEDIEEILRIATEKNLILNSTIFEKKPAELTELIEICERENVSLYATMYLKDNKSVKKMIKSLKDNHIKPTSLMYSKGEVYLDDRIKVCNDYGLVLNNALFRADENELELNYNYIKDNYGTEYVTSTTMTKANARVKEVFQYMASQGLLKYLPNNEAIFTLKPEDLKARIEYLKKKGLDIIEEEQFSNVLTMTKRKFKSLEKKDSIVK